MNRIWIDLLIPPYPVLVVELEEDVGKIRVEETVEDGVGAAGGDSDQVADEVGQHHRLWKYWTMVSENNFKLG